MRVFLPFSIFNVYQNLHAALLPGTAGFAACRKSKYKRALEKTGKN
jgi:hypothetical protein